MKQILDTLKNDDKDAISLDNEGQYTLRVIKKVDEDTQFTYWTEMKIAGIYKPKNIECKPTPLTQP